LLDDLDNEDDDFSRDENLAFNEGDSQRQPE